MHRFSLELELVICLSLYGSTFKLFNYRPQSITPITIRSVPYTLWLLPSCLPIGPSLLDPPHRPKPAPVFVFTRTPALIVSAPVYLCVSLFYGYTITLSDIISTCHANINVLAAVHRIPSQLERTVQQYITVKIRCSVWETVRRALVMLSKPLRPPCKL